jgi:hypothetical protein
MKSTTLVLTLIGFLFGSTLLAADTVKSDTVKSDADKNNDAKKYDLKYRFKPGETLTWEVVHRGIIKGTVNGTTQTTENVNRSKKVWKVEKVDDKGNATFVHKVTDVDMWHKMSGSDKVHYNSNRDKKPPYGFENAAARVDKPLVRFTLSPKGKVVKRENLLPAGNQDESAQITLPLPDGPVALGETWRIPHEISLPLETGGAKKVQTQQSFTLKSVKSGIARIKISTQILTPINHPALEAKLIERERHGIVRFNIDKGQIADEQMDLDKAVIGFRGPDSSLHYRTRSTEKLLSPNLAEKETPKK